MSMGETIAPFIGRVILAWFFLAEAYTRATNWDATVTLLDMQDVPFPPLVHFLALTVMVLASISLIIGFRARLGALGLFAFVVVSNVFMNDYWNIADVIERQGRVRRVRPQPRSWRRVTSIDGIGSGALCA